MQGHGCAAAGVVLMLTLTLTVPAVRAQDDPTGRSLAATCANCHGTNGQARGEMKPLAGLTASRIVSTMNDYKSGVLAGTIMPQIAKGYTDEQVRLVAAYLAAQRPRP